MPRTPQTRMPAAVYAARRARWSNILLALTPLFAAGALLTWPAQAPTAPPGRVVEVAGQANVSLPSGGTAAWARILSLRLDSFGTGQRRRTREVPCRDSARQLPDDLLQLADGERLTMRAHTVALLTPTDHDTTDPPPGCTRDHRPRQRYRQRTWALRSGQRFWLTTQTSPQLWPLDASGAEPLAPKRSFAVPLGYIVASLASGAGAWWLRRARWAPGGRDDEDAARRVDS